MLHDVFNKGKEIANKVTNVLMNYTEVEAKVRDATSNEPWGPSGTAMNEIASLTHQYESFNDVMSTIWKRLFHEGSSANWRSKYKSLVLLLHLVRNGSERVIGSARDHTYDLRTLENFCFTDEQGKNQGINVQYKVREILKLLSDNEKLREERQKARKHQEKFRGGASGVGSLDTYSNSSSSASYAWGGGRYSGGGGGSSEYRDEPWNEEGSSSGGGPRYDAYHDNASPDLNSNRNSRNNSRDNEYDSNSPHMPPQRHAGGGGGGSAGEARPISDRLGDFDSWQAGRERSATDDIIDKVREVWDATQRIVAGGAPPPTLSHADEGGAGRGGERGWGGDQNVYRDEHATHSSRHPPSSSNRAASGGGGGGANHGSPAARKITQPAPPAATKEVVGDLLCLDDATATPQPIPGGGGKTAMTNALEEDAEFDEFVSAHNHHPNTQSHAKTQQQSDWLPFEANSLNTNGGGGSQSQPPARIRRPTGVEQDNLADFGEFSASSNTQPNSHTNTPQHATLVQPQLANLFDSVCTPTQQVAQPISANSVGSAAGQSAASGSTSMKIGSTWADLANMNRAAGAAAAAVTSPTRGGASGSSAAAARLGGMRGGSFDFNLDLTNHGSAGQSKAAGGGSGGPTLLELQQQKQQQIGQSQAATNQMQPQTNSLDLFG